MWNKCPVVCSIKSPLFYNPHTENKYCPHQIWVPGSSFELTATILLLQMYQSIQQTLNTGDKRNYMWNKRNEWWILVHENAMHNLGICNRKILWSLINFYVVTTHIQFQAHIFGKKNIFGIIMIWILFSFVSSGSLHVGLSSNSK